ncbi:hypothetical protein EKN60_06560 [Enterobacter hormaechei]|nr:hypothetical protein CU081_11495 [Enterobacter sp. CRENT-193]AVO84599.1 hypothetical protein AM472_20075 [Enterobacter cloacae complex sp.]KAA0879567.1 hypothetical protein EYC90_16340 [Enterobacter hormaechei]RAZ16242.1 hypothetical protein DP201_20610 [Enterobacter hormaechei subsp. xiangfangensis]KAA0898100.1 hypothetical protein EYC89_05310 [Enterobacter hormaechei]
MLRNHGECYCESTHRLLQKYDRMRKKAHEITFHFRISRVCVRNQTNHTINVAKCKKTNIEERQ